MYKYSQYITDTAENRLCILIPKLLSGNFQKHIIQCWLFRKYPSKRQIIFLKIIQNMDQIMAGAGTADCKDLIFILQVKNMREISDFHQMMVIKDYCFNCNCLTCFYHFFEFFLGSGSDNLTVIHNCDPCADLFHFLHIV